MLHSSPDSSWSNRSWSPNRNHGPAARYRDHFSERTPRFVERVFTDSERDYCESKGAAAAQSFAGRFAAKEAFLKAIKTGWRGKITWHDIEIHNDKNGAPFLEIHGEAERPRDDQGSGTTALDALLLD